jgi:hypothetical protein
MGTLPNARSRYSPTGISPEKRRSSLWGHGSLSECNKCTRSSPRSIVCPLVRSVCPSVARATQQVARATQQQTEQQENADRLEQEPGAMSNVTIVASIVASLQVTNLTTTS